MMIPKEAYEQLYRVRFTRKLGAGKDGFVLKTNRDTAVKFSHDVDIYGRELNAYILLSANHIQQMLGHQIPVLQDFDDSLRAIEMSIVLPPFLLDFAAAYTVQEIAHFNFAPDVISEREAHWADVFGDRWPEASALRDEFERQTGLVLLDLNLNNIRFE